MFELGIWWEAKTDTENQATAREVIDGDGLARELPGTSARDRRDQWPEANMLRLQRDGRQADPGINGWVIGAFAILHMIPEEEPIPSGSFSCASERGRGA